MCFKFGLGLWQVPPISVWPAWHVGYGTSCTEFCHPMDSSHQHLPLWKGDEHNPAMKGSQHFLFEHFKHDSSNLWLEQIGKDNKRKCLRTSQR